MSTAEPCVYDDPEKCPMHGSGPVPATNPEPAPRTADVPPGSVAHLDGTDWARMTDDFLPWRRGALSMTGADMDVLFASGEAKVVETPAPARVADTAEAAPDGTVEAVARALYEADVHDMGEEWRAARVWPPALTMTADGFRDYARIALSVAAARPAAASPGTPEADGSDPMERVIDRLTDDTLWSDADPDWLRDALPVVLRLMEPELIPIFEGNLDHWQKRAEAAEAALAARDREVPTDEEVKNAAAAIHAHGEWVAGQIAKEAMSIANQATDPAAVQAYRTMAKAASDYVGGTS